jgi:hypothetical protein
MELFDVIKRIFENDSKWKDVSNHDKARNFFMINRIMSIQFPIQANQFNKLRVSPVPVVNWWHATLSPRFKKSPKWIFTQTSKANKKKSESKILDFTDAESLVREKYGVSIKDLNQIKKFYPDKYNDWMEKISSQINTLKK